MSCKPAQPYRGGTTVTWGYKYGLWSQTARAPILVLPSNSSVALGNPLTCVSVSAFAMEVLIGLTHRLKKKKKTNICDLLRTVTSYLHTGFKKKTTCRSKAYDPSEAGILSWD